MGLFSITPKKKPSPPPRDTYYIEPTKEENPDEATQDKFIEQENQK